jgi:signal peptidase II
MDFKAIWNKVLKGLKWFFFSYIWIFILFFVIDIVTKQLVVNYFKTHTHPIVLIPGFLQINYTINEAAAFGFGLENATANRVMYCIVAFIGLGIIIGIYVWKYKSLNSLVKACLMLMAVGALGNLVDRLFYSASFLSGAYNSTTNSGGVVDWIDFCGIWQFIFNIADSAVVVGTIILIVYLIVDEIRETKKRRNKEVKETNGKVLSKEELSRLETEEENKEIEEASETTENPQKEEK